MFLGYFNKRDGAFIIRPAEPQVDDHDVMSVKEGERYLIAAKKDVAVEKDGVFFVFSDSFGNAKAVLLTKLMDERQRLEDEVRLLNNAIKGAM